MLEIFVVKSDPDSDIVLKNDLQESLNLPELSQVKEIACYQVDGIDESDFEKTKYLVFGDKAIEEVYLNSIPKAIFNPQSQTSLEISSQSSLMLQYLPGQYDQRADWTEQCLKLLLDKSSVKVQTARWYIFSKKCSGSNGTNNTSSGNISHKISSDDIQNYTQKISDYLLNPLDSKIITLAEFKQSQPEATSNKKSIEILKGFRELDDYSQFIEQYQLSLDVDDLKFMIDYFKDIEQRDPTITELRVIDTYWSDHCRHTTFLTNLTEVKIEDPIIEQAWKKYLELRDENKAINLMDLATFYTKYLKKSPQHQEKLKNLDVSEEINAASFKAEIEIDGEKEDWIIFFKNETHNHPTEIEPFSGAATCLGGAIRDPLSGRAYVYQGMRITGAGDPTEPISKTLPHKLPQKKICREAALGFSSYGNQIGLATGLVHEFYHPGFKAKRLEMGACIGANKSENIIRQIPEAGDKVLLIGGRTGRDGIGGATGSSKVHRKNAVEQFQAEVQKGNPVEERKLQRLFFRPEVSKLIKRCNDFGAGGVAVAVGELADGLSINLDAVPKKYQDLDGTELAISESQERMAVVLNPKNVEQFKQYCVEENIEATEIAEVTDNNYLEMSWNDEKIVHLNRDFLNSNGAPKFSEAKVKKVDQSKIRDYFQQQSQNINHQINSDPKNQFRKNLVSLFDSTVGGLNVNFPFAPNFPANSSSELESEKYSDTNSDIYSDYMASKLPQFRGFSEDITVMSFGYDPYLSELSPFYGGYYAVIESICKLICGGVKIEDMWFSFQEYFAKPENFELWGDPLSALLGANTALQLIERPAIGGKDSMSGTYEKLKVPPTLISVGCGISKVSRAKSNIFDPNLPTYLLSTTFDSSNNSSGILLNSEQFISNYKLLQENWSDITALTPNKNLDKNFAPNINSTLNIKYTPGSFLVQAKKELPAPFVLVSNPEIKSSDRKSNPPQTSQLEPIKLTLPKSPTLLKSAQPQVFIPVFPGTNCEFESIKAFQKSGAKVDSKLFINQNLNQIQDSVNSFADSINEAQIIMFPGGFSAGDEPGGSAKFISSVFQNPQLKEAISNFLVRGGLILGICNGFQALVKLGLLPYGEIIEVNNFAHDQLPTLTTNITQQHISTIVGTKVTSLNSPWLQKIDPNKIYQVPISHGEGRFRASKKLIDQLIKNQQVAFQYCDLNTGEVLASNSNSNPNGSDFAIEGLISPNGQILGKMSHIERVYDNSYINYEIQPNETKIFESGVEWFL